MAAATLLRRHRSTAQALWHRISVRTERALDNAPPLAGRAEPNGASRTGRRPTCRELPTMAAPVTLDNARTDQLASSGRDGAVAARERHEWGAK